MPLERRDGLIARAAPAHGAPILAPGVEGGIGIGGGIGGASA
jgi:hypothetical protein